MVGSHNFGGICGVEIAPSIGNSLGCLRAQPNRTEWLRGCGMRIDGPRVFAELWDPMKLRNGKA